MDDWDDYWEPAWMPPPFTVYVEDDEVIDTGLLDAHGKPIIRHNSTKIKVGFHIPSK